MKERFHLSEPGLVNALGTSTAEVARGLFAGDTSGMVEQGGWLAEKNACVGSVSGLPAFDSFAPGKPELHTRNNAMLWLAVQQVLPAIEQAKTRHGPGRIGVVMGTSTSGIAEGEAALAQAIGQGALPDDYRYEKQELGAPARFVAQQLGLGGPAYTVSTACTSSAKAFASARNLLASGVCDAVVVGGADSLSRLTVQGFAALESLSPTRCNPMSANRRGINIGEGAAAFVMSREPTGIVLSGVGESSDAWHVSAPHPEGRGAIAAIEAALADAGVSAARVGYVNLHATATPKNDEMESLAVSRIFAEGVPASGTKPMTGHMLGTAGATELAFCWLALRHGRLPPHIWDGQADPALAPLQLVQTGAVAASLTHCLSNSFAFGGSNASLLVSLA